MSKVIKMKQSDLYKIANKIIQEQSEEGIPPFPAKKPQEMINKDFNPGMTPREPQMPMNSNVTDAKVGVRSSLIKAKRSMEELIRLTQVNPEIGGITSTIEKTLSKFEEIFGLPKTDTTESKK